MEKSKAGCTAFDKAVNLLAFKDRTTYEIRQKLSERGYSSNDIQDAVEKLTYYGYLNDKNYTISYIRDNTSKKGKRLIDNELIQKGIDKSVLADSYELVDVDELSTVEEIYVRRYASSDISDDKGYRRVVGYFLRRGFTYDTVKKVLNKYKTYEKLKEDY